MSLSRRKDGRWCRTKTINGERIYFYSTESTEKKALRDIESREFDTQYSKKLSQSA